MLKRSREMGIRAEKKTGTKGVQDDDDDACKEGNA